MFGVSRVRLTRKDAKRVATIAERHGSYLVEANIPGTGYQRWFCTRNYGDASNNAVARSVIDDLAAAGLKP